MELTILATQPDSIPGTSLGEASRHNSDGIHGEISDLRRNSDSSTIHGSSSGFEWTPGLEPGTTPISSTSRCDPPAVGAVVDHQNTMASEAAALPKHNLDYQFEKEMWEGDVPSERTTRRMSLEDMSAVQELRSNIQQLSAQISLSSNSSTRKRSAPEMA